MNKLINIMLVIVLLLFNHFVMAQQSQQEVKGEHYKQSYEDQVTSAATPIDTQAERLNDLNSLDSDEYHAKYGYTSDVLGEYADHLYKTKVLPASRERQRQEEADKQKKLAIKTIFTVISLALLSATFFTIRKHSAVVQDKVKELAEKLKIKLFNFRSDINKKVLKKKYEKEVVRQKIKEKVRAEVQANKVTKNNDVNTSTIDLSKLKQDIDMALKNGDYNKVKELTDLAEKLTRLN